MTARITFGEWLSDRIKDAKQTQSSLAEQIDTSPSAVSQWVNNIQRPHRRTLRKVASALGLDVNEALLRAEYPSDDPTYVLPEDRPDADDPNPLNVDPNLAAALHDPRLTPEQVKRFMDDIADKIRLNELEREKRS